MHLQQAAGTVLSQDKRAAGVRTQEQKEQPTAAASAEQQESKDVKSPIATFAARLTPLETDALPTIHSARGRPSRAVESSEAPPPFQAQMRDSS